jgi:hypothetical protein
VAVWSYFLLRNIPPDLLRHLIDAANEEHRALSDLIRAILCARYDLDCPASLSASKLDYGATTQRLRLQPELFQAIKDDAADRDMTMRAVVLDALNTYMEVPAQ